MNRKLAFSLLLGAFAVSSWAQQAMTVKGTVKDSENNPVIGATVVVKGTTIGTTTDIDGNYTINVNPGQVLEFSYVGMQQSFITVGDKNVINITMADGEQLDEVVVIGYGTVKKRDLTGAVASVSSKDLQANIAKSAAGALQGRIAGVSVSNVGGQPGSGMSINIRGLSSLGSNTPLYVIDGVYGDINMVDPADIASLEVLKDASAAAIYGSRAANGVVLITTKGGKKETPTTIDVNVYSGFQNITKKLDVLDAQQWISVMKQSGYLPESAANFQGAGTNWQDEVYRTAPVTKANLNISGGTKTATYNVSAGYINQQGILLNSGYSAFNVRAKNTFSFFNDHFRVGNTLLVKTADKQINDLVITDPLRQNPLMKVKDPNQLGGYAGIEPWMKNMDNPVGYSELFDRQKHNMELLLNAYAEIDLGLKGLKYKLNFGYNKNNGRSYNYNPEYNFGSGAIQSSLSEGASFGDQWLVENTLHYDNTFGKHTVSGLFGYSAQENKDRSFGAARKDIPAGTDAIGAGATTEQTTSGSLQEHSLVSLFARAMYSYDSRYMISASIRRDGSSRFADGHRYGVFPSVSAGWNIMNEQFFENAKKTVDELKLRLSYGVLGNQEIGNYTTQSTATSGINYVQGGQWWMGSSTGVNWVSPKDLTWEETRTTNIGLDASFFNGKLSFNADYFIQETKDVLLSISMPPSVGMGGSPTMNAGTIQNKGFELVVNHRNTVGEVYYNVGVNLSTVSNKIKEITVGSDKQEFAGYNPQGEGTITWAKVGDPIGAFYVVKTDGIFQNEQEIKAHTTADGKLIQPDAQPGDIRFIDYNGDGQISDDDRQYAGSPFPDVTFGIRGNVQYKGFDLGLFFDGMIGNKIYNYTRCRMESMNEFTNFGTSTLNAWTEQNRNTDMPRFTQEDKNENRRRCSDRWLENGSFFRLKTLEFGYTLPQNLLTPLRMNNLRIYTAMDNLFTATKYTGYTPDLGQNDDQNGGGDGTMTRGCDHGRFPLARTITFGVQLNF
ncbi:MULTISPECIES: TonB-dependent receptor [Parabacteroides]|uniref:SusC/RagA family TonB-linked outer membrane protein n=1 Tax=Parabacteroides leei TaxID=2939491 RepID=UPI001896CCA5|nr:MULTISPECIES: TonB-dependent receptor [Parabacteroides]MCL3853227.1 TonB-dependent receptor [Parabacteroides leei]